MCRHVLVTAGAAGIGKEKANAFINRGKKVLVCNMDNKALQAVVDELPGIITTSCAVSKIKDVEKMVRFGAEAMAVTLYTPDGCMLVHLKHPGPQPPPQYRV